MRIFSQQLGMIIELRSALPPHRRGHKLAILITGLCGTIACYLRITGVRSLICARFKKQYPTVFLGTLTAPTSLTLASSSSSINKQEISWS